MKIKQPDSARCPPLSMAMLEVGDDGTAVVVAQIKALMDAQDLPFGTELCLERADSGFGKASFLSPLYAIDVVRYETTMQNQRPVIIRLHRWNDLMLRSKNGHNMKQKRFDVVRVEVLDCTTQKPVFDRPMFLAVSGKRKTEIETKEAHLQYRERYMDAFYGET